MGDDLQLEQSSFCSLHSFLLDYPRRLHLRRFISIVVPSEQLILSFIIRNRDQHHQRIKVSSRHVGPLIGQELEPNNPERGS